MRGADNHTNVLNHFKINGDALRMHIYLDNAVL